MSKTPKSSSSSAGPRTQRAGEEAPRLTEYFRRNMADYSFSRWKILLISAAGICLVTGAVLRLSTDEPNPGPTVAKSDGTPLEGTEPAGSGEGERIRIDGPSGGTGGTGASAFKGDGSSGFLPGIDIRIDPPDLPGGGDSEPPDSVPGDEAPSTTPPSDGESDGPSTDGTEPDATLTGSKDPVSNALLRGGFGFFVGFCMGFATRTLLRFSAIVIGGYFLVLIGLSGLGWVEIRWDTMGAQFNHFVSVWGPELQSIESFLAGKIPVAGATVAGLYAGLRRK